VYLEELVRKLEGYLGDYRKKLEFYNGKYIKKSENVTRHYKKLLVQHAESKKRILRRKTKILAKIKDLEKIGDIIFSPNDSDAGQASSGMELSPEEYLEIAQSLMDEKKIISEIINEGNEKYDHYRFEKINSEINETKKILMSSNPYKTKKNSILILLKKLNRDINKVIQSENYIQSILS
jgi:hypothetical protein